MKKFYTLILLAVMAAIPALAQGYFAEAELAAQDNFTPSAKCLELIQKYNYPSYYCDCSENFVRLRELPNTVVTDTIWYKASAGLFLDGMSAYLFSENSLDMIIMLQCQNKQGDKTYRRYTVESNQSMNINGDEIKEKLNASGTTVGNNTVVYVCIAPSVPGAESHFICMPYNQGPHSTCDECLPLIRNMELVSSNMDNVYSLAPSEIPAKNGLKVEWNETEYPVSLTIRKGECASGAVVASTMIMPNGAYELPTELLNDMRGGEQNLYLQFMSTGAAARIRLSEVQKTPTGCEDITTPATDARLMLQNGMIYILRDGVRYTLTGARF